MEIFLGVLWGSWVIEKMLFHIIFILLHRSTHIITYLCVFTYINIYYWGFVYI